MGIQVTPLAAAGSTDCQREPSLGAKHLDGAQSRYLMKPKRTTELYCLVATGFHTNPCRLPPSPFQARLPWHGKPCFAASSANRLLGAMHKSLLSCLPQTKKLDSTIFTTPDSLVVRDLRAVLASELGMPKAGITVHEKLSFRGLVFSSLTYPVLLPPISFSLRTWR